jgi:multimeric flavodoxin WrbA
MKILAINGSRRKNGNTSCLVQSILYPAEKAGAAVESLSLGDYAIDACTGCEGCRDSWQCVIEDDFSGIVRRMDEADGVILASPTYWYSVTSDMKRFVDRCYSLIQYPVSRRQWIGKYRGTGKACVTVAVCEQLDPAMMGNTLSLLTDFVRDIGLEVVDAVQALGFFAAGSVKSDEEILRRAENAGERLLRQLKREGPESDAEPSPRS